MRAKEWPARHQLISTLRQSIPFTAQGLLLACSLSHYLGLGLSTSGAAVTMTRNEWRCPRTLPLQPRQKPYTSPPPDSVLPVIWRKPCYINPPQTSDNSKPENKSIPARWHALAIKMPELRPFGLAALS